MKKNIFWITIAAALISGISSCNSTTEKKTEAKTEKQEAYQCPMKCEGEKTYPQPGQCPSCNMELVKY